MLARREGNWSLPICWCLMWLGTNFICKSDIPFKLLVLHNLTGHILSHWDFFFTLLCPLKLNYKKCRFQNQLIIIIIFGCYTFVNMSASSFCSRWYKYELRDNGYWCVAGAEWFHLYMLTLLSRPHLSKETSLSPLMRGWMEKWHTSLFVEWLYHFGEHLCFDSFLSTNFQPDITL